MTDGPGTAQPLLKAEACIGELERSLAITCPSNLAFGAPEHPIVRDPHHVFARPFGKALQTGSTDRIGRVRYGLLRHSAKAPLLAPYSVAYVSPHPGNRRHDMLPGRLHIFLGDRGAAFAPIVDGKSSMRCDHITIEPTKDGAPGLSAHLRDAARFESDEPIKYQQTPLPLAVDGSMDLGTLVIRDPQSMQCAGSAILPRTVAFQKRRDDVTRAIRESLEPWHPVHTLPEATPWNRDHHLSLSFVLSKHALEDKHYPHHRLAHESVVEGFEEHPDEPVRFQAIPLDGQFLIVILKVSRGRPTTELLWSMKRRAA